MELVGIQKEKKWEVYIMINFKQSHLGYFKNINDAIEKRRTFDITFGFTRTNEPSFELMKIQENK